MYSILQYIKKKNTTRIPIRLKPILQIMAITDFTIKETAHILNINEENIYVWVKLNKVKHNSFNRAYRVATILEYIDIGNPKLVGDFLRYHNEGKLLIKMIRDKFTDRTDEIIDYIVDKRIPSKIARLEKLI